ncbi:MAG: propanediol dehydratase [Anaerotignum sp.]|jgi:propanediol dehydratase medium subunit|nr:propanediol dehydratase [Anaerotignum sp.]
MLEIKELGLSQPGTDAKEIIIAVSPAFGTGLTQSITDVPLETILKELCAGIEEEGMNYRFVKVYNSTDLGIIASQGSKLAGSGICVAMQSRGTTVIHQRDLLPLDNLELFPQSPLITTEMYRTIGKTTAKYGKGESPEPVEILNDYMVPSKFLIKSTLMHFKEGKMANRDMAPIDLEVKF